MKSLKNRVIFFVLLFIAAFAVYFVISQRTGRKKESTVYTTVSEPSIPVVWADTCGKKMDCMRGYVTETTADIAADTLIILPQDRKLPIHIEGSAWPVLKVTYEIRSIDLSELVERTEAKDPVKTDAGTDVTLPIQNLLTAGKEYRMDIILSTKEKGDIHYYSRIMTDEAGRAGDMVALADGFSTKNFDYDAARENTTYLETDATGDNTTFGKVTLKSNYSQLTYGKLKLSQKGSRDVRLTEYNGSTGLVGISFTAEGSTDDGSVQQYEISESFTMRMGPERLYMMDYTRTMHEVFTGSSNSFTGQRILLGITEGESIQSVKSTDAKYTAFVSARDLWMFDSVKGRSVKVYSFRSGTDSGIRANYEKHNIRILSCETDGSVEFLLYGYMNRGPHEGETGISLMRYDASGDSISEQIFIPSKKSFEEIDADVSTLSYLGSNSMLYLKLGNGFYGLDVKSSESIVITDRLSDGTFAVSPAKDRIAWQDTDNPYGSETVHFMNLDNGGKKELKADGNQVLKPLGFIDRDLIAGTGSSTDVWNLNGTDREIPFTAIEIVDDSLVSQKHYEKKGYYLTGIRAESTRIHLKLLKKSGDHTFVNAGEDTVVSNTVEKKNESFSFYAAEAREKTYFIPLAQDLKGRTVKAVTAASINYGSSNTLNPVKNETAGRQYFSYGHGKLLGIDSSFGKAVDRAYGEMGLVRSAGTMVYCRAAAAGTRTLKNPDTLSKEIVSRHDAGKLTDLYGASLREVLYFVGRGLPVLGFSDRGEPFLIYAYDRTAVSLYGISSGAYEKKSVEEAESMFGNGNNDFSCSFTNP
jgi:hypothetical protein